MQTIAIMSTIDTKILRHKMLKFWQKFYILFNFFLRSFVDASIIPYGCDLFGVQICVEFMGFFLSMKLLNFIHIVFK